MSDAVLRTFYHLSLSPCNNPRIGVGVGGGAVIMPIMQMRKQRLGEVKWLIQSHKAGEWQSLGWKSPDHLLSPSERNVCWKESG